MPNTKPNPRPSNQDKPYDVVVVGGRCAGAATAMLLARRGHRVAVVERSPMPSDTLSTHGFARGGVVQLHRWGLLDAVLDSGTAPVRDVTFGTMSATTVRAIKESAGVDLLVAPRRHVLDNLLHEATREAGATMHVCTTATGVTRDPSGRVAGVTVRLRSGRERHLRARYVVGADGIRSSTAGWFGAETTWSAPADVGLVYGYVDGVDWHGFELRAGEREYAGVFPTHDGAAAVWLIRPNPLLDPVLTGGRERGDRFTRTLEELFPDLGTRVRAGRLTSPVRGWRSPPMYRRRAAGRGWALVGDAASYCDPISGHGITDAYRDAELLADRLHLALRVPGFESVALAEYEALRDAAAEPVQRIAAELVTFPGVERFTGLQRELAEVLDREAHQLAGRAQPARPAPARAA